MKINFQERIENIKTIIGIISIILSILITLSFLSFYQHWEKDQNKINKIFDYNTETHNLIGNLGAFLGDFFIKKRIGISSFIIPITLFIIGINILINKNIIKTWKYILNSIFIIVWMPIFLGYFTSNNFIFSGLYGFKISEYLKKFVGNIGTFFFIISCFLIYILFKFKITYQKLYKTSYLIYSYFQYIKNQYNNKQILQKNKKYEINNNKKKSI